VPERAAWQAALPRGGGGDRSGAEAKRLRRAFDLAYAHAYKRACNEPAHERRYTADIEAMPHREAAEVAELALQARRAHSEDAAEGADGVAVHRQQRAQHV
jgi:hypothetical protein